jgi:hypothetical protein
MTERSIATTAQYGFATNSSCAGKRVRICGPSAVTTTSSSMRAAEKPSDAGQYAGLERRHDVLVDAVDHGRGLGQQHDLVG